MAPSHEKDCLRTENTVHGSLFAIRRYKIYQNCTEKRVTGTGGSLLNESPFLNLIYDFKIFCFHILRNLITESPCT